jgi:hypothetical protein
MEDIDITVDRIGLNRLAVAAAVCGLCVACTNTSVTHCLTIQNTLSQLTSILQH